MQKKIIKFYGDSHKDSSHQWNWNNIQFPKMKIKDKDIIKVANSILRNKATSLDAVELQWNPNKLQGTIGYRNQRKSKKNQDSYKESS